MTKDEAIALLIKAARTRMGLGYSVHDIDRMIDSAEAVLRAPDPAPDERPTLTEIVDTLRNWHAQHENTPRAAAIVELVRDELRPYLEEQGTMSARLLLLAKIDAIARNG